MSSSASSGFATVSTDPDVHLFYTVTPALPVDPGRPAVVLAGSLLATTALWDDFVAAFAPTHTVVRYDARFHGQSPLSATPGYDYSLDLARATGGLTVDRLADDVLAVLDAVGLSAQSAVKPSFIGLSIGAGVGLSLAARHGDRFDRFVLVGTRSHADTGPDGDTARLAARAAQLRAGDAKAQAAASVQRWFGAGWVAAHPAAAARLAEMVMQTPLEGFTASSRALATMDLRPHAGRLAAAGAARRRVLFAAGALDDPRVVAETQALAAQAGSRVALVADSGHIVPAQQAVAFQALVRGFLEGEAPEEVL